ncbi:hypothetical protein JCM5350_004905 [Sporobolomyces pararoseus]
MRSVAALSALAVPALALSYSHGDPRSVKRHHQLAEHVLEQRDQVVAPSSGRMARRIKRGEVSSKSSSKKEAQTYTTTAIWYAETGWIGSCGVEFNDNDLVLGLPLELYPNPAEKSELCGQSVVVKNSATGQEITAVVADASQRDAYTTFTKGAYQALGGDLDVGELSVSYHFADADSISPSLPSAFSTSATGKEKSAVKTSTAQQAPQTPVAASSSSSSSSSSGKAYSKTANNNQAAAAPQQEHATTQAPTTTQAPPAYDSASAASASSKAAADAAWASSSSEEAAKLWASSSSAQAAAASASAKAKEEADAAWASSSAAAAAASSKAAADAAWASSSSKAAAAAATSAASNNNNNNNNGGGHTYTGGIATFFWQNGVAGNCGKVNSDDTPLVALPTATYENGAHCGKYVTITRSDTGKSIQALVADSCPTCNNNACLDLSWGAFSALGGTQSMGVFDITWQFDN